MIDQRMTGWSDDPMIGWPLAKTALNMK